MARRALLAALACGLLSAHSPYRQWDTFRKSRLIVFANARDERSQQVAQRLAERLEATLPDSRATWARAPDPLELVKLLNSHQADVILLTPLQANQARAGAGRFELVGEQPLHLLAREDGYLLLCLDEYPSELAWALAKALGGPAPTDESLPLHPGAAAHHEGREIPLTAAAPAKP